jgi:trehalose 2-sulfotransferase
MMSLAYVICTSPRTGSTLLCKGLAGTGRAGAPAEFFDHRSEVTEYWMRRYSISTEAEFASNIIAATTTPNGVFGTKLHWTTLLDMHRALRASFAPRVTEPQDRSLNELLRLRFSEVRYIWLRRRNKVAQGISHFRAYRSGVWESPQGQPLGPTGTQASVEFDSGLIDHCINSAQKYDREWEAYFRRRGIVPMQLFYEDFINAYDQNLRTVLAFLDIPHIDLPNAVPQLERLADATSLRWERRYRALKAECLEGGGCGMYDRPNPAQ